MSSGSILVIRLSAMGDVALTLPAVRQAALQKKVVVLTKPLFCSFFENIDNVSIVEADTGGVHKGLSGIYRLFKEIRVLHRVDYVLDLHSVIRSRILSALFRLSGIKVFRIDKGRRAKRRFIKTHRKEDLIHTTERYRKVFLDAGLKIAEPEIPAFKLSEDESRLADKYLEDLKLVKRKLIAIAPYAMHPAKQWPEKLMKELIGKLDNTGRMHIFLFGGRQERGKLLDLCINMDSVTVVAGDLAIREELALISKMDLMISMDSSNLHMAAVSGINTLSIWGGTHPLTGFGPLGKQGHIILGLAMEELDCRPCTIYGKGECKRKDEKYKCLNDISPASVIKAIKESGVIDPW